MKSVASIYVGKSYQTNTGGMVTVIGYEGYKRVRVRFLDGTEVFCRSGDLKNGEVRNPNQKDVYGVGFFGQGPHKCRGGSRAYRCWSAMMRRCYSDIYHLAKPTYKDCLVDLQWHNYQEFAEWCSFQKGFNEGWHLDKDIISKGNKIYTPDVCVFVPNEVNCLFNTQKRSRGDLPIGVTTTGSGKYRVQWQENGMQQYSKIFECHINAFNFYKENKERVIKQVASKWKGLIDDRVHFSMMSYEVEIDD